MNRTTNRCMLLAPLMILAASGASGQTAYVDDNAPGGGNGLAWATAYTDLQDALDDARLGLATEIRVAQGKYVPGASRADTFGLVDNVPLRGGYRGAFDGTGLPPDDRDTDLFITTLSGDIGVAMDVTDNSLTVVTSVSPINQLLEGFYITFGWADIVTVQLWTSRGAGLFAVLQGANNRLTVRDCWFGTNYAYDEGGGAYVIGEGGTIFFDQCLFTQNLGSPGSGGAVFTAGVMTAIFDRCGFFWNIGAVDGGALHIDTDAHVVNCIFDGNYTWSGDGAGAWFSDSTAAIQRVSNCTFANNDAGGMAGGIYLDGVPPIDIANTILWDNISMAGHPEVDGDPGNYIHCDIKSLATAAIAGFGNFEDDPLFVDPLGPDGLPGTLDDDLTIQCGTMCVNGGSNPSYLPRRPLDYAGNPRLTVSPCVNPMLIIDVGAYELQP